MRSIAVSALVLGFLIGCASAASNASGRLFGAPKDATPSSSSIGSLTFDGPVPKEIRELSQRSFDLAIRVRGLPAKTPVILRVLSPAELVALVKRQAAEELPPEIIRREGQALSALGVLPEGYDYEAETFALLEEALLGLYSSKEGAMYVSSRVTEPAEIVETLTHELTHALHEQHFHSSKSMKWSPGNGDRLAALDGLSEGDATSVMLDALLIAAGPGAADGARDATELPMKTCEQAFEEKVREVRASGKPSRLFAAPRSLALDLIWPYVEGQNFVNALRRRGGWKLVNEAWGAPPTSTEQMLHVEKFLAHEPPLSVEPPTGKALGAEFSRVYDDILGEMGLRIVFDEWMTPSIAAAAASGWGGDHLALFEASGGRRAIAARVSYDDDARSANALTALSAAWSAKFGAPVSARGATDAITTLLWGVPASSAASKEPIKPGSLPPLPPSTTGTPATTLAPNRCRALVRRGVQLTMLASAPCATIASWATEVGAI